MIFKIKRILRKAFSIVPKGSCLVPRLYYGERYFQEFKRTIKQSLLSSAFCLNAMINYLNYLLLISTFTFSSTFIFL